jgi:hypothetical protein
VKFLNLDITVVYSDGSADFAFKVYRKPGRANAYLLYGSYHARHMFRGWFKAEMHRLLTQPFRLQQPFRRARGTCCILQPPAQQIRCLSVTTDRQHQTQQRARAQQAAEWG